MSKDRILNKLRLGLLRVRRSTPGSAQHCRLTGRSTGFEPELSGLAPCSVRSTGQLEPGSLLRVDRPATSSFPCLFFVVRRPIRGSTTVLSWFSRSIGRSTGTSVWFAVELEFSAPLSYISPSLFKKTRPRVPIKGMTIVILNILVMQ